MSQNNRLSRSRGFTLIEMLVIAPIALLVIASFIALMVVMVGDVIAGRARNVMTYDVQSALNSIEQDVRLSTQFLATSGTMIDPQGKDGNTAAFTSTSGDLVLGEIATDKNPVDPARGFVYYDDTPFDCSDTAQLYKNRISFVTVVYFIRDGSLWKRTYVPAISETPCATPWQVNTCAPGYDISDTWCQANDSEILKDVKSFSVDYYSEPQHTIPIAAASAVNAQTIRVTLESEKTSAGRLINTTSSARSTKLSSKDVTLAPPASPVVTGSSSGGEARFTWPGVPGAASYIIRYNINGGPWITASENTTENSFEISGARNDTVFVKVFARNTTGASADIASNNASATIPLWTDCALQNGWVNYNAGYETCGYTISKDGIVMLKGHIAGGSTAANVNLFQLPDSLRPSTRLMYQMVISPNVSTRVDVNDDGWVRLAAGANNTYVGLDGIYFIPKDSLYTWTTPTLVNGWTSFGSGFSTLQTTLDASGRVHTRGLIKQGTFTNETTIAQLPVGSRPSEYLHFSARGDSYNLMGINSSGNILAKGISSSYYSAQSMFYPSGFGGWQSFSGSVGGNPADNQMGNGWVAHGAPYAAPQYTKSTDGIVTIKGLIRSGSTANLTFMAKLPPGYRPLKTLAFSTASDVGGRIDVGESGYLIYRAGGNGWLSLDGISYMAEQ